MKKRYLGILATFMALATIPMFSSNPISEVGAADENGKITVGGVPNTFGSNDYVSKFSQTVTASGGTSNLEVTIELYKDVSASYLVSPSYLYSYVEIKLNGHNFKVTSASTCTLAGLNIDGGGGTIDFGNVYNSGRIFSFDKGDGKAVFSVKNVKMINMKADQLFVLDKCAAGLSTINFENCYFSGGTFEDEGGILCNDVDQIKTINFKN